MSTTSQDSHDPPRRVDPRASGLTRRGFLSFGAAGAAGVMAGTLGTAFGAAPPADRNRAANDRPRPPARSASDRTLIRGGIVLSLDERVGDYDRADVLVEGPVIVEVAPEIEAEAEVIDARGMIVMPGFSDTHRHMWQGQLRNVLPDGRLSDYGRYITGEARAQYEPEDAYIGNLVSALGAIHAGVTTVLDWSHIGNSPEHTDAAIAALRESGLRAVYAYGSGTGGPDNAFPDDIVRLRREHFSSDDQLLTLALAGGLNAEPWRIARDAGAFVSIHVNGTDTLLPLADELGPDVAYIHCCNLSDREWRLIADTGGGLSIAGPIEMQMGHGVPPFQQGLDHGIPISLSNDVETSQSGEFFSQMRAAFALQRMLVLSRERAGEADTPALLTTREVVEIATLGGATVNQLADKTGSLTPGKRADIIMLDTNAINVAPVNDAYGAVVLAMETGNVRHVMIDGRVVKWHGQLVGVDVEDVLRRAAASRDGIFARAGWTNTRLGALQG
jgi:5-methylthioadenosine/S-adenosylhomocysteine deaminase